MIQHAIMIKQDAKRIRKRQRQVNLALEATIRKELEKLLVAHIFFPINILIGWPIWSLFERK